MDNSRLKILIIDDEPINLLLLGEALEKEYNVQIATSGKKGLTLATDEAPDLILLDIMMPEMDGHEVCRQLKTNPILKDIPVIFITALVEINDEITGLELGAADYLTKPINIPVARLRIHNLLEREAMRKQLLIQEEQQRLAASVFSHSHDGILISDTNNNIIDINKSFTRITGYKRDEVIGKNPNLLKSGYQDYSFYQTMWESLAWRIMEQR